MEIPSKSKILRAVGVGLSIGCLVAAYVGWSVASIYESKLDSIYQQALDNGGAIVLEVTP